MIEAELQRIANALEAIAQALNPGFALAVALDAQEEPKAASTLTKPPLAWFEAVEGAPGAVSDVTGVGKAQANFDWLNVVPGKLGRKPNNPGKCSRCGREGRRKLNHCDYCAECKHEAWWDE